MSFIDSLKNQKTHVIYLIIIFILAGVGYTLFSRKPTEVIKTVTQTKVVDHNIVKVEKQYINRTITKKDPDGTITTTTETIVDASKDVDKSKEISKFTSKTDTRYLSKYTLGVLYPISVSLSKIELTSFNANNLQLIGGIRLFNSPILINIGTNPIFNQVAIGFTVEL